MFLLKKEHVLKLLDNLLYFSLLGLGIYFIYRGDVIPKFFDVSAIVEGMIDIIYLIAEITNIRVFKVHFFKKKVCGVNIMN